MRTIQSEVMSDRFNSLRKNKWGVFEIPLPELRDLRFTEIPFYSTVGVAGLPGSADTYSLEINATHGGGPQDETFYLFIHVTFRETGGPDNPTVVKACRRRTQHIKRFFSETANSLELDVGEGGGAPYTVGDSYLLGNVLFSRVFEREEDPVLTDVIEPVVARFDDLLTSADLLLFLCHASEDKPFVDDLCAFLDAQDVAVWYDRREINVGDSIVERIGQGLGAASHVVIVLSQSSVRKPWVLKEMSSTLMRQLESRSVNLLPVLIENCTIPPLLSDIKYADCRRNRYDGFNDLLEAIM